MKNLRKNDIERIVRALPEPVLNLLMSNRVYLAGGLIRNIVARESAKTDIDLFGMEQGDAFFHGGELSFAYSQLGVEMEFYETENAVSLIPAEDDEDTKPVQLVHRWPLDTAEKIVEHFDFTVCAAVVWWDPLNKFWKSQVHDDFYTDTQEQRLVYVGSEEPGSSLLRAFKYSRKGYRIYADSIAAIVDDLNALAVKRGKGAPEPIIELLREIDPLPEGVRESTGSQTKNLLDELEIPF